jgi:DNA-binding protein YbaB
MIKALSIDPAVVDPDDAEFLQTLVLKAVQDALNGAKNMAESEMRKVTGGLGFPM